MPPSFAVQSLISKGQWYQLADMDNAKKFVRDAIKLDSKYKLMALDDADLEPLWDSLRHPDVVHVKW